MNIAVITTCGHFFHAGCLRKWLYVQDTCPMCHHQVNPPVQERDGSQPHPVDGREEQVAAPRANGTELAGVNENTATQEHEGSEPTDGEEVASTQRREEHHDEGGIKDAVAKDIVAYHPALEDDRLPAESGIDRKIPFSTTIGSEPCESESEDACYKDCYKSTETFTSNEQRAFLFSDIRENSSSSVNEGTPEEVFSVAEDNICIEDGLAQRLHERRLLSIDNIQGIHSREVETQTKSPSSMSGTDEDLSEIRVRSEAFETEPYSSRIWTSDSGEINLHTSSRQRMANDCIIKDQHTAH